jgi:hypothetical protein
MHTETAAPALANMSAPPRSTVTLPRLVSGRAARRLALASMGATLPDDEAPPLAEQRVGPGGGALVSNALCLAQVALPAALGAHLRMGLCSALLTEPLGLARALVAVARQSGATRSPRNPGRAARLELDRVAEMPEGALVQELTERLESVAWPAWVPRVAFVLPRGEDIATAVDRRRAPAPPHGVTCPLLSARLVAAVRGPVFLRDAAPSLSGLLDLWTDAAPTAHWELWLPVRPGTVIPVPAIDATPAGDR